MRLPSARVRLHTESAARSFFAFCSAQGLPREPSSPLALLHTLDVTLATVNLADIGNLITLLANVPVLTSLTLHDPEKALRRQESLYAALQRLRTLQTFRVHEAGAMTFKLVSEIASALEDVAIDPYRKLPIDDDTDELNLSMVLARHKDTLTRVCVWRADVMGNGHRLEGDLVVFEKVRELVIHECVTTGAADCIRVFPNAVSLDVGNNLSTHMKWSAALNHMRLGNFAALLYDGSFGGPDFWPTLERVRGGLLDLYIFGILTCVEALEIDGVVKDDWKRVPSVVQVYKPDILHLAVSSSLQVDVWEKHRSQFDCVGCLVLRFVVEDLVDLKKLTVSVIAIWSYVPSHLPLIISEYRIQLYAQWGHSSTVRPSSLTSQPKTTQRIADFRTSTISPSAASWRIRVDL